MPASSQQAGTWTRRTRPPSAGTSSQVPASDQLNAVANDSKRWGTTGEVPDLALLVDGLQAEREQGITIDVAYRYFSTPKRKFIVADCPGHEQYTRNMATGASTADLAVVLVDARKGLLAQTRRHSYIVSLLGIRHVVLAVNKMDLAGYDQARAVVRREIVRGALLDHGKLLTGVDWRIDTIAAASRGAKIAAPVVLLTLSYQEGEHRSRITLHATPDMLQELQQLCAQILG